MAVRLNGGPFDGVQFDPSMMGGPGGEMPPEPGLQEQVGAEQSSERDWAGMQEAEHFNQLMDGVRALLGKLDSEQNKLKLERVTTLLQEIRAADEAEQEQALKGQASPRLMRRAYSGAQGGGGY